MGGEKMKSKAVTMRQRRQLRRLADLHEKFPNQPHGFNPPAQRTASYWRRMEPMGLVSIDRVSERHFRYSITDAGRAALADEGRS